MLKVGFGLQGDIRLLARSGLPGLCGLQAASRALLGLDRCRDRLLGLLEVPPRGRGLSGLCHAMLGRPLSKLDQISDW